MCNKVYCSCLVYLSVYVSTTSLMLQTTTWLMSEIDTFSVVRTQKLKWLFFRDEYVLYAIYSMLATAVSTTAGLVRGHTTSTRNVHSG